METNKKLQNNVHVKFAQTGNFGEANVGNDAFQTIKITTESKWKTIYNNVHVKYAQPGNFCEANVGIDAFQTIKVTTDNKWKTICNNVHVKFAQTGNFGEANVGIDAFQTIKVTTDNKWKTILIMFMWSLLRQGTVVRQMLATTPFASSQQQLEANEKQIE